MVCTRGSKTRFQQQAFAAQNHKYTRRKDRAKKEVQTDGNQRIMAKNVSDGTVSHRVSKFEPQTVVEAVTLRCPAAIPVSAQRKTRHQFQNDQASGVSVHATGENPTLQYTRRNAHAQKKVQTDGNQGILTGKNVTNATVSHRVSKVELQTDVEAVTLKRPGPISVSIQRETRRRLQNDQASGVNGENPTLQHRELHMNPSQDSQQEASSEANPTAIVSARDSQSPSIAPGTKGPSELHLSSPLNACAEARKCDLIVSSVSATRGNFDGRATMSLNLAEFAAMNDEEDLSDIDSLSGDSSLVSVNGYLVKPETVALLTSVLSKYGDIGAKCSLKSTTARSFFLQKICDILDKLLSTTIGAITENKIADMRAFVSDIGNANVEVAWLQKRLDEIYEAKKAIPHLKPNSVLKLQHAERKKQLGAMKERFEAYRKEFADRHAEALDLRNKIVAVQSEISVTEKEVLETDKVFSESKALKKVYDLGSLVKGLI